MPQITKPTDVSTIWCSSGDLVKPTDTKIQTGWEIEIPPRQWFNWLDNRQDTFNAHVNQHGVAVWDAVTEYQADKSYTQGVDGIVYKCLQTHTNISPPNATYWKKAFLDNPSADENTQSLTATGFTDLGNGLMMQWGVGIAGANDTEGPVITFAKPFTTQVFSIVATHGPDATGAIPVATSSVTLSSFRLRASNTIASGVTWQAVGV